MDIIVVEVFMVVSSVEQEPGSHRTTQLEGWNSFEPSKRKRVSGRLGDANFLAV